MPTRESQRMVPPGVCDHAFRKLEGKITAKETIMNDLRSQGVGAHARNDCPG